MTESESETVTWNATWGGSGDIHGESEPLPRPAADSHAAGPSFPLLGQSEAEFAAAIGLTLMSDPRSWRRVPALSPVRWLGDVSLSNGPPYQTSPAPEANELRSHRDPPPKSWTATHVAQFLPPDRRGARAHGPRHPTTLRTRDSPLTRAPPRSELIQATRERVSEFVRPWRRVVHLERQFWVTRSKPQLGAHAVADHGTTHA